MGSAGRETFQPVIFACSGCSTSQALLKHFVPHEDPSATVPTPALAAVTAFCHQNQPRVSCSMHERRGEADFLVIWYFLGTHSAKLGATSCRVRGERGKPASPSATYDSRSKKWGCLLRGAHPNPVCQRCCFAH